MKMSVKNIEKSLSSIDAFALSDDDDFWFIEFENNSKIFCIEKNILLENRNFWKI